jgi:hypothetical protein
VGRDGRVIDLRVPTVREAVARATNSKFSGARALLSL